MAQKKYQIFVSSTFRDLTEERQAVIHNILDLKHIPAGMELFPATDIDQLDYIKKIIDECDYYVLIMGGRYGSMDENGISYTEREYDYAVDSGKFVLAFVHSNPDAIPVGKSDISPNVVEALLAFRNKVMTGRLVKQWSTLQELELSVLKSLNQAFTEFPQVGWIRGDSAASNELLEQSNKALQENKELTKQINQLLKNNSIKIDNIAELDDEFEFRYEASVRDRMGSIEYWKYKSSLSWRKIFLGIAGHLNQAKTDSSIFSGVKEALNEAGVGHNAARLNETDKTRIKIQLVALGLIRTEVLKTTKGDMAEFLMLTDKGRTTFIDGMVVRKADPHKAS